MSYKGSVDFLAFGVICIGLVVLWLSWAVATLDRRVDRLEGPSRVRGSKRID